MAIKGITLPKKEKKHVISYDEAKHVGTEPKWDTERAKNFDTVTFDRYLRECFRFYNYFFTQKDMKKHVVVWAQKNMELARKQLSTYIMSSPELTPMTVCSLVKAEMVGMPMREKDKKYIIDRINTVIKQTEAKPELVEKIEQKESYAPSIQERLAEKTAEIGGEIEGEVDNAFKNLPTANIYDLITSKNLAQSQVGKLRAHFQKQIDEVAAYAAATKVRGSRSDEEHQLVEGYDHLKNADLKRVVAFYTKLMSDFDSYAAVKKANKKARKPKAFNKEKAVANVKFLKESTALNIVSLSPASILGAQVVWVYNVKSRKIGKYVAQDHSALSIKGTSITGYSETSSVQKTIRKPEEQLKEFMKAGKVALRTWVKDIRAVETKLNGRLSKDVLILKVE